MTVEIALAWLGKVLWLPLSAAIGYVMWLMKRDKEKLDNVYTKEETVSLLDLKILGVQRETQLTNKALTEKVDNLFELIRSEVRLNTEERQDNNKLLNSINTEVQIMKNDILNIKEDIDDMQLDIKDLRKG